MKIAFVVGAFPKLSETFVLQQICGLLDQGHDVSIFAFERSNERIEHQDVVRHGLVGRTDYISRGGSPSPSAVARLLVERNVSLSALRFPSAIWTRLVHGARGAFDVIYCHFGHVAEEARRLRHAGFFSGPIVAVFHAYDVTVWLRERGEQSYSALFEEAALLLPISEHWRKKLVALGAEPDKVRVARMGVDCGVLEYRPRSVGDAGPIKIASVGRLVEKKGFEYAISAIAKVRHQLARAIEYHVIGDGPLQGHLESLAAQRGVSDCVVFHGWKRSDEALQLLEGAQILLAPSVTARDGDMEGIPVVIMEAMAQGMPVVSTRHSGIPELVVHRESGYLVPERDVASLAEALVELIGSPEDWRRLTDAARREVERQFDSRRLTHELSELLSGLR